MSMLPCRRRGVRSERLWGKGHASRKARGRGGGGLRCAPAALPCGGGEGAGGDALFRKGAARPAGRGRRKTPFPPAAACGRLGALAQRLRHRRQHAVVNGALVGEFDFYFLRVDVGVHPAGVQLHKEHADRVAPRRQKALVGLLQRKLQHPGADVAPAHEEDLLLPAGARGLGHRAQPVHPSCRPPKRRPAAWRPPRTAPARRPPFCAGRRCPGCEGSPCRPFYRRGQAPAARGPAFPAGRR